ncbi:MAG: glycosyltransferase family 4 protein [Rhodocyclaceae bacterium]|nr:glycosyltransferase family 4 protein [Rhodocyclaceae bacterium]
MALAWINGRFLARSLTGVDRFAGETLRALDALLADGAALPGGLEFRLAVPPGVAPVPWLTRIPMVTVGGRAGQWWEQTSLPRHCGDDLLINLCNTGPMWRRRQWVVIHDAATFAVPEAYSWKFRAWYRVMIPRLFRRAAGVATVSEFSRGELRRRFGDRSDVVVLPEGADHIGRVEADAGVLDRHGLRGRPYVLAVSSLSPHKNFAAVVEAVRRLGTVDFDVVVAGGQNPRVFGGGEALPDFVRYVGYVSDGELAALYQNARCFIFPSRYEGFGLPPVEAMASGCPVLAARAASMPEVCGDAALYFDPGSPDELADGIRRVMADEALRTRLVDAARARAGQLSWRATAQALIEHVSKVI